MAVARELVLEVAAVALVCTLVEVQGALRRHVVRVEICIVTGVSEEHGTQRRAVGGGGIAYLENDFVRCVIGPEVLEEALGGSVVLGGAGETEGAGIDHLG